MRRLLLILSFIVASSSLWAQSQKFVSTKEKPDYWGEVDIVVREPYGSEIFTATVAKPDYWGEVRINYEDASHRRAGYSNVNKADYWGEVRVDHYDTTTTPQ